TEQNTSLPNMQDWRAHARTFETMATFRVSKGPLIDPTPFAIETQWVRYAWVTDNFFSVLGRSAAMGRAFTHEDFATGQQVALITHSLWQSRFGGASDVIGKRMRIGGVDTEIIGVMPQDFWFPTKEVQLWLPASLDALWQRHRTDRGTRWGIVF